MQLGRNLQREKRLKLRAQPCTALRQPYQSNDKVGPGTKCCHSENKKNLTLSTSSRLTNRRKQRKN